MSMRHVEGTKGHAMSLQSAFGHVLREIRESKQMSQEDLAFASGYHRTYISLLERGKKAPSLTTIFRLASSLKILPFELIKRVESQAHIEQDHNDAEET